MIKILFLLFFAFTCISILIAGVIDLKGDNPYARNLSNDDLD